MPYNTDVDTVSIHVCTNALMRKGDALIEGTPVLIAGRREEMINACKKR